MLEGMNKTRGIGEHMGISLLSCVIQPERMQSPVFFFLLLPSGLDLLSDLYVP